MDNRKQILSTTNKKALLNEIQNAIHFSDGRYFADTYGRALEYIEAADREIEELRNTIRTLQNY